MNRYRLINPKPSKVPTKLLLLFALLLLIGLVEFAVIWWRLPDYSNPTDPTRSTSVNNQPEVGVFDKAKYSVNESASFWAVVNKGRKLPADYVPDNLVVPNVRLRFSAASDEMHLRSDAAGALERMVAAAAKDNTHLRLSSGYRSYSTQSNIYAREVRTYGQAQADRQSARSGHSEHQTGLAADLAPSDGRCEIADCFADTKEGKWLAANAHKHGFIIRYPDGKEDLTGYKFEPWHFRYVGKELSVEINRVGQTLEQFFNLPTFSSYPANVYELR